MHDLEHYVTGAYRDGYSIEPERESFLSVEGFQTDNQQYVSQVSDAQTGPEGQNVEGMMKEYQLREIGNDADNVQAPTVNTNPESAYRAVLGNQYVLTSGHEVGSVVSWRGNDRESRYVTVMCTRAVAADSGYPSPTSGSGIALSYRPYIKVRFGTRGNTTIVEVDLNRGTQVTVVGASVYVDLGMDPAPVSGPSGVAYTAGTMLLGCSMGWGATSRFVPNTRTRYLDNIFGLTNVIIPTCAQTLLPVQYSGLSATLQLDVKDAAGTVLYSLQVTPTTPMTQPLPLANDAYSIDVTPTGTTSVATINARLVFALTL